MRSRTNWRMKYGCLKASAALTVILGPASGAVAQSLPPAGAGEDPVAATDDQSTVSEIIVTANRRRENLQDVPIAVTAISGDQAMKAGVTDTQSLVTLVPGLTYNRASLWSTPFLRGVGNNNGQIGNENSVSLYIDDVYLPASTAAWGNFNSVAGIEVLRGPQGTLFGRNATGGVVQINTKDPTSEPAIDISAGYANYATVSGSLYATSRLTENLSANIALYGTKQNHGWGRNFATGNEAYRAWNYGGRIKLLWTPSSATEVRLTLDHDTTRAQQGVESRPHDGTLTSLGYPPVGGFYDVNQNIDGYAQIRQSGVSLKVSQDLGHWAKLVSISAYRYTKAFLLFDLDGGPTNALYTANNPIERTGTQELRIISRAQDPLSWVFGVYYFNDRAGLYPFTLGGSFEAPHTLGQAVNNVRTRSYAAFAQTRWAILDGTHLTTGLRYTIDNRSISDQVSFDGVPAAVRNSPQSAHFHRLTGRISLDQRLARDLLGYVAFNRGYKSGFFNFISPLGTPPFAIPPVIKPETLDAYTAGLKTEFFRRRLRANIEGFYYKYRDIQVQQTLAGSSFITNAASARIKGIDAELTAVPATNWTVSLSAELLHARYTDFVGGPFVVYKPTGGNCTANTALPAHSACDQIQFSRTGAYPATNLNGNSMIQAPPFSLSAMTEYRLPTAIGPLTFSASWSHSGGYYSDADNGRGQLNPSVDRQQITDLVAGSIGWQSSDQRWAVTLWGKNLTGAKSWSYNNESSFITKYSPAPPRTYGITLAAHL